MIIKKMKRKKMSKKGISLMVSFVLLIGISIALAGLVYGWLKFFVQKPFPEEACPEVSIMIYNYTCDTALRSININLQNRGLFNISGIIAKMNDKSETEPGGGIAGRYPLNPQHVEFSESMPPGQIKNLTFFYYTFDKIRQIELEPFIGPYSKPALCDKAILKERIDCA